MKKITIVCICLLFVGVSLAAATPRFTQQVIQPAPLDPTGTFEGSIGYGRRNGNWTELGTMNGNYTTKNRGARFTGEWIVGNWTGSMRGGFWRFLLLGRVTAMVNGTERTLPIMGFIFTNSTHFAGRFMSFVGPALYFKGTHT